MGGASYFRILVAAVLSAPTAMLPSLALRLKLLFRHFARHKSFTLINILGLSAGMACVLYSLLFIRDELAFDQFHVKKSRIYRVGVTTTFNETENRYPTTSAPLAEAIRNDIPEVEACGRLFSREGTIQLLRGQSGLPEPDKKFRERNVCFIDPQLLDILTFNFLEGNPKTALSTPSQALISRQLAERYFGSVKGAMNRSILFEGTLPLVISGVFEDYPDQTHLQVSFITHFENYYCMEREEVREFLKRDWLYNPVSTYILLKSGVTGSGISDKVNAINKRYADERVKEGVTYQLQSLSDIHLFSNFSFQTSTSGIRQVFILGFVSFFILLIACFNFINLSTVHSLRRAPEIGLRKALGADKWGLMVRYFAGSGVLVFLSLIIAGAMLYVLLPYVNTIMAKDLTFVSILDPLILAGILLLFVGTSLVAGFYPALYITRFSPIRALRGQATQSVADSMWLRRILVMLQFVISIVLIVVAVVVRGQLSYLADKPLGFNKERMVTIPLFSETPNAILGSGVDGSLRSRMNEFEHQVLTHSSFEGVTVSSVLPGSGAIPALVITDKYKEQDNIFIPVVSVDYDFIQTYGMEVLSGRPFSKDFGSDHLQAFVLNEEAVRTLGFSSPDAALGQTLQAMGKEGAVIGVIRNYHFEGLQQTMRPLIMEVAAYRFTTFTVRIAGNELARSLATLKSAWEKTFPERVFEYHFLDEQLAQLYDADRRFGKLANLFCVIAIVLSCLGLFGLSAYINHMRLKEVSIRKVLGASTRQVFITLSGEFARTLLFAVVLAVPAGYFLARAWLADFAYRIPITWIPFTVATVLIFAFVLLTITYHTMRAATSNPAEVLKRE